MEDLFASPGSGWTRVSPRLAAVRRTLLGLFAAAALVGLLVVAVVTPVPVPAVAGLALVLAAAAAWAWWLIGRSVSYWGYAEQEDELHITKGMWFRRLVVVPYGRMQYVDIHAGPLEQLVGIAQVQLHTASPGTSATIPGLTAGEAARLRDRLTALGQTQGAGL